MPWRTSTRSSSTLRASAARAAAVAARPDLYIRKQRGIASQRTEIVEREQQLGVVGLDLGEVGDLADVLPDREPEIPKRLQQPADSAFLDGADLAADDDQEVEIGVQAERAAPVAADRADGDRRRDVAQDLVARSRTRPSIRSA